MFSLNQLKSSLQDELDNFFQVLGLSNHGQNHVSKAALCKARNKLKPSAFIELNRKILRSFYEQFPVQTNWYGLRLLAVDGSKMELPNSDEIREIFGVHNSSDRPMGLLSTLYDLNNRLWLDAELVPLSKGEREVAAGHLEFTRDNDLLIYDRGYPAFWFFSLHRHKNRQFCMRLPYNLYNESTDFWLSDEKERIVTIHPDRNAKRVCLEQRISTKPVTIRLIRVELDSDQVEILATSLLDPELYPARVFGNLYHKRWGHEEGYKLLKIPAELQNWTGKRSHTLFQDLNAKLLTLNLAAMQAAAAQIQVEKKTKHRKHSYQVNRSQSLSRMKNVVINILDSVDPEAWIRQLINITAKNIEPIRPGRKYPRNPRLGVGVRYKPAYKRGR
jgi:hypothetical protein